MSTRSSFYRLVNVSLYITVLTIFLSSCAQTPTLEKDERFKSINPDIARKYAIYAMMASNSYQDLKDCRFPLEKIGWNVIYTVVEKSGLAYNVLENERSNEVVFAFRGTESSDSGDWFANFSIFSSQDEEAHEALKIYKKQHDDKNIRLTGHSLGGGLAIGMSLRLGWEALTFNPSLRYGGFGSLKYDEQAKRIIIFQEGEVLEPIRKAISKFIGPISRSHRKEQIVLDNNVYVVNADNCNDVNNKLICKHSMEDLAFELLKLGKSDSTDNDLSIIYDEIDCNNK